MPLLESKLLSLLLNPVEIGNWKVQFRLGLAINSTTLILITAYQHPKILYYIYIYIYIYIVKQFLLLFKYTIYIYIYIYKYI